MQPAHQHLTPVRTPLKWVVFMQHVMAVVRHRPVATGDWPHSGLPDLRSIRREDAKTRRREDAKTRRQTAPSTIASSDIRTNTPFLAWRK